jgi:hypothetical protein
LPNNFAPGLESKNGEILSRYPLLSSFSSGVANLRPSETKSNSAMRTKSGGSSVTVFFCPALKDKLMSMFPVDSSSLAYVGFENGVLVVVFHTSSTTYHHYGVPYSVFAGLMNASSMGAYYNRYIRGRYR